MNDHDQFDRELLANVRPADWVAPTPKPRYHLVVIGAGTAGLVSAAGAASLGATVALIEKHRMGGDCLNYGCVPSKALLRAARAARSVRDAHDFGIDVPAGTTVDFPRIMARLRSLRQSLSPNDSARRFRELGVDVFFGTGRFVGVDRVQVGEHVLNFKRAIVATGTRAAVPSIPGLAEAGFLTNETVFSLGKLPKRLLVLGAGPIGCELGQAFARLGSIVTLVGKDAHVLPREDADAGKLVGSSLQRDGVRLRLNDELTRVEKVGDMLRAHLRNEVVDVDRILIATGRSPNIENLGLDEANIRADAKKGVLVDDYLRTSNRRVFAVGDIASPFKFTHAADALARLAVRNALFMGRGRASDLILPWCTYTEPEVAHVGLTVRHAQERGIAIQTFDVPFSHVDRAVLDGEVGSLRVHVKAGTDRIVGATIVGSHAGDMIGEIVLAMVAKKGLGTLSAVILPYPTLGEAIKKAGDAYQRTRLTPWVRWLFRKWFEWT